MKHTFSNYYGCLMGYAIGDALGAPIEFMNGEQIRNIFGAQGIEELVISPDRKHALVTDDTQLMMFTCEGLLRSVTRAHRKSKGRSDEGLGITMHRAYLRWLYTQGLRTQRWQEKDYDGWLVKVKRLHAYREPGVTCLTALGRGIRGTVECPINDSLGCGCVGRAIPVGLFEAEEDVFRRGMITAAITHGHPTSYLAAGTLAYIIYQIISGEEIRCAVEKAIERLKMEENHEMLEKELNKAVALAKEGEPSTSKLESLGKGFVAHEVLAMAIYSAMVYADDYKKAVVFAVNQGGDSDSIGSITGGLVGAYSGSEALPEVWIKHIEMHGEIERLAQDMMTYYRDDEAWLQDYPAW